MTVQIKDEKSKLNWLADSSTEIKYRSFKNGTSVITFYFSNSNWGIGRYSYDCLIDQEYLKLFREKIEPKLMKDGLITITCEKCEQQFKRKEFSRRKRCFTCHKEPKK